MDLFFSGVTCRADADLLAAAGGTRWLLDPTELTALPPLPETHTLALDSGVRRAARGIAPFDWTAYWQDTLPAVVATHRVAFALMPEVWNNPRETYTRWGRLAVQCGPTPVLPVWSWGETTRHLREYLDQAPLVAVRLTRLQRQRDPTALEAFAALAANHGARLHVLTVNWAKAVAVLAPLVRSLDTSLPGLTQASGHVVFRHSRTGRLMDAPALAIPAYRGMSRPQRMLESARSLLTLDQSPVPAAA